MGLIKECCTHRLPSAFEVVHDDACLETPSFVQTSNCSHVTGTTDYVNTEYQCWTEITQTLTLATTPRSPTKATHRKIPQYKLAGSYYLGLLFYWHISKIPRVNGMFSTATSPKSTIQIMYLSKRDTLGNGMTFWKSVFILSVDFPNIFPFGGHL